MIEPAEEEHFKTLFEYAPIALWEEDYSNIKRLFDELRQQGILSLGAATSETGLSLEKVINIADDAMYRNKGEDHRRRREDQ